MNPNERNTTGGNVTVLRQQIIGYALILILTFLLFRVSGLPRRHQPSGINDFLFAGRKLRFSALAPSLFVSWVWTTTIMGAAEAGIWYGVSGGLAYSFGAAFPFLLFIPIMHRFQKIMPEAATITEFISQRYNRITEHFFFVFCNLVVIYVMIEQAVGIGAIFRYTFGIPFKVSAFLIVMIVTLFVFSTGLTGIIRVDIIQFFLIIILFATVTLALVNHFDLAFLYRGLSEVSRDPGNINYNPEALMLNSVKGITYGFTAAIVAMGQVLLDQGYYTKARAALNAGTLTKSFLFGAIFAWIPVAIISAIVFGSTALALNIDTAETTNMAGEITSHILSTHLGFGYAAAFAVMILMIGVTTATNCLIGIQTLFTVSFYREKINTAATESQQIWFGRVVTLLIGFLCGLIAISLEGISLLKIDIFSGIFFAAPCTALIAGFYYSKTTSLQAVTSILIGLTFGLGAWIFIEDMEASWFYGTVFSLLLPAAFILITGAFTRERFNFHRLRFYPESKNIGRS